MGLLCLAPTSRAHADEVVGAKDGKVYHTRADCLSLRKIAVENRVAFKSVTEAEAEGRRHCKMCERLAEKAARSTEQPPATKSAEKKPPPQVQTTKPAEPAPRSDAAQTVRVKKVLPGGTLQLDNGERITFAGACLPQAGQDPAEEATSFIQERVKGRKLLFSTIRADEQSAVRDSFGRIPGRLKPDPQKPDLGGELIKNGLAWVDREARMEVVADYIALEDEAWQKGRGIWKRLDGESGRAQVVAGRYALHYHPVGCPHVAHLTEPSTITVNEAKARRLTPCENYRSGNTPPSKHGSTSKEPSKSNDAKDKNE